MITPTKAAPPRVSTTVERAIRRPALPELGGGQGIAAHEPGDLTSGPSIRSSTNRGGSEGRDGPYNRECLAALPLPLAAIRLLWLNLVTNGIQHVGLAFEPGEPGAMRRPPRSPGEGLFDRLMLEETLLAATAMGLIGFAVWAWLLGTGMAEEQARALLLVLFVLFENFHVFNARSEVTSAFRMPLSRNRFLVLSVIGAALINAAAMYIPFLADVLRTGPIGPEAWGVLIVIASSILVVMEAYKLLRRPTHSMRGPALLAGVPWVPGR